MLVLSICPLLDHFAIIAVRSILINLSLALKGSLLQEFGEASHALHLFINRYIKTGVPNEKVSR